MPYFRYQTIAISIASMLCATSTPTYAFDRNAALGIGLGLGLLGGMLRQPQQRYVYAPRRAYVVPRHRIVRAVPRYAVAPRYAAAPPLAPSSRDEITTDEPWIVRYYSNCNDSRFLQGVTAHADKGFVKDETSTRMVCGGIDHMVKQFSYLSPQHYAGPDIIRYYNGGRLDHTDYIQVGDYGKQNRIDTDLSMTNTDELTLVRYSNCDDSLMEVRAQSGYASIRNSQEPDSSCKSGEKVVKRLVYRSAANFSGTDHVTLYSDARSPLEFTITISAPQPAPPPPIALEEPKKEPSQPATPVPPTSAASSQKEVDDLAKALGGAKE